MSKSAKMTIGFFTGYVLLMASLISTALFADVSKTTSPIHTTEPSPTFKEEFMEHERKVEEKRIKNGSHYFTYPMHSL
ncbi:hypothetical protein [Bacillus thermotolerans]|uniref:hypothetical protein n=1 Tax=Bacillus thermotolerans TaxID=1221996 RepID=UPI000588FF79|nr:hypothetical protein [Bacillus thermotolerans]